MPYDASTSQIDNDERVAISNANGGKRRFVRGVILLSLLAVALRVGFVAARSAGGSLEFADERDYWSMATSLAAGRTMTDADGRHATRMPGYPAFLALFVGRGGPAAARVTQAVLGGAGIVLFVALIARRIAGVRAALLAAALVAIDPFLIFFTNLLLVETLFIALLWMFIWLVRPREREAGRSFWQRCAAAGIALTASVYVHPSAVVIGAAVLIVAALRSGSMPRRAGLVGVAAGVTIVALLPWALRNRAVIGETKWLTTRGGITLYDGVGPQATGESDLAYTRELPQVAGLDEAAWDAWFTRESRRMIREQPGRIVRLAWPKFVRTWSPLPHAADYRSAAYRIVSAVWTLAIYLLAAFGVWRLRGRCGDVVLLLAPAIAITLTHLVLPGSVRYRLPAMPGLEILAAVALAAVLARSNSRTTPAPRV